MKTPDIKENIVNFEKDFQKSIKIPIDEFSKYFHHKEFFIKNNFISYETELFEEILFEMFNYTINILINEVEYYVNPQGNTIMIHSDSEVIQKEDSKEFYKTYYSLSIIFKELHEIYIKGEENSKIKDFLEKNFPTIKDAIDKNAKLQSKLIENLKLKLNEINKKEDKYDRNESSIFH